MSNHLAIATVTAALRNALLPAVHAVFDGSDVTIQRLDSPARTNGPRGVNIFLYQVTPNTALRNDHLPTRRNDGTLALRPQVALDLHYLLTFYGDESLLEPQRVLGRVVSELHRRPVLTREMIQGALADRKWDDLAGSDLANAIETVKFTPLPLSLEELSKLWSVFFQTPYSLSVAYQASAVLISTDQRPTAGLPVRERTIHVQPSVDLGVQAAEPDTLADLQLWLRADAAVTHDNLGFVSQWSDQSGNGNHAGQGDDARKPSFVRDVLDRKPVMRFDGVDDYFAIDNLHYDTQGQISAITIFALFKSVSSDDQVLASFDGDHYWQFSLRGDAPGGVGWQTRSATGNVDEPLTPDAYNVRKWHLIACRFDASASPDKQVFVDGEEAASIDAHGGENIGAGVTRFGFIGVGSEADVVDGATGPAHFLAGDLAEFLIYNRALSDVERQQIERYFVKKYTSS